MRKNDKKQRRSLLFSTAVVVTGCLLTAFYVNQEMPKSEYEVDLSQLSAEQKQEDLAGDMRTGDAGVAKVTGNDVQNPVIAAETDAEIVIPNPGFSRPFFVVIKMTPLPAREP